MKKLTLILAISALTFAAVSHDSLNKIQADNSKQYITFQNTQDHIKTTSSKVHAVNCNGRKIFILDEDGMYLNFCKAPKKNHSINLDRARRIFVMDEDRKVIKLFKNQMR